MIRISLVGDIGSGKSHIAKLFNYPLFNADLEVSKIYRTEKKSCLKIKKAFPKIDFTFPIKKDKLVKCILSKKDNIKKLSKIVHPIIRKKLKLFLKKNKKKKIVILDIPLYLENNLFLKNDIVVFISAKNDSIKRRLIKRKGHNKRLIKLFKSIQLPLYKKKKRANYIIKNNFTNKTAKKSVKYILDQIFYERNNTRHRNNWNKH